MKEASPLDNLYIATACNADWEKMKGDDKVRACQLCQKNVYNISNMTKKEAELLLRKSSDSLCVGYYRRADGTIMTDDCPVALKQIRKSWQVFKRIVASLLGLILSSSVIQGPAAMAVDRWKTKLIAQNQSARARFGGGANVWKKELTPQDLKTKEGSNSIEQAVYKSEVIVLAQFIDLKEEKEMTFFSRPKATYKVVKVLKGKLPSKEISVTYVFHDESKIMRPEEWKYSKSILPAAGDSFILFLVTQDEKGLWYTYNGSFGRYDYKPMNLRAISLELQRQSCFTKPRNSKKPPLPSHSYSPQKKKSIDNTPVLSPGKTPSTPLCAPDNI